MKICFSCGCRFEASDWQCPACNASPTLLDGFPAFAPNLAEANDGFEVTHFDELAPLEAMNFWFRSRDQLIVWVFRFLQAGRCYWFNARAHDVVSTI